MKKSVVKGIIVFVIIVLTVVWTKAFESKMQSNLLEDDLRIHFYEDNPGKESVRTIETEEGTVITLDGIKVTFKTKDGLVERSSKFVYNTDTETGYVIIKRAE